MKVLITVTDDKKNVVKQNILDAGHAMADALWEVTEGNTVAMTRWDGGEAHLPDGFIFDLRLQRVIN